MNIFDFVTQEEIDDLPGDNSLAFMMFVRYAERRLAEKIRSIDTSDRDGWAELDDARHGFMNVVVATAKRYGIEPVMSLEIPNIDQFDVNSHRRFRADLDHYMTQLVLDSSIRARGDTVLLSIESKDRIRAYIHGLKVEIDKAAFTEAKRADLLDKLAKFEASLDNRRLNLMEVMAITIAILGLPGGLWTSYEIVAKLTTNVLEVVAEAKLVDDENRRLPMVEKPMALLPPRKAEPMTPPPLRGPEMDDEIPF